MTSPFEEGNPEAPVCILGEAPSRTEVRMNRPFVGPSGQLLDQCLHAAGMIRRECYITNLFDFQVRRRGDKVVDGSDTLLWQPKGGLTEEGLRAVAPCLERLTACKSNVIVPLGGVPASVLGADHRITKWRGSILWSDMVEKKFVPTIHPAASLHGNYLWRYLIMGDLKRAAEESKFPEVTDLGYNFLIDPSFDEAMAYLTDILHNIGKVAFDIECTNHQCSCLAFATSRRDAICIPFTDGKDRWTETQEVQLWELIAQVLEDPSIVKIGQNMMFDTSFMLKQNNILTRNVEDLMVAHHIIWPDFPKGLDFICSMHTRQPYYKDDGKMWKRLDGDLERFWRYNATDAVATFWAWEEIQDDLDKGFRQTYDETIEMFPPMLYMMQRGICVNMEALAQTKADVEKRIREKEEELRSVADYEFNIASPKQCQEYFYVHKGIKPYISRKTGRPTTDDKAMSRIVRRFHLPEAKLVQELRALKKLHGTYLEVGVDKDSRVRCSYNPRGTVTGRLSSSQTIFGTGMNMQNLHPEFKSFLVSDDV